MRNFTNKRAAHNRAVKEFRMQYLSDHPKCIVCNGGSQCLHEMAKGVHRKGALGERCAVLAVCYQCNSGCLEEYDSYPLSRQYALKYLQDPVGYDRVALNKLRGRAENAIDEKEVLEWVVQEVTAMLSG
jgi:hypothetical protein